ncbi:uncharacterized protein EI97DRAFT_126257 [Westerdykella ornata]|uniref:Uncharacterized protein n=1 Tax=Westerdykella ornata TaxID=318751 RepID=A0A6A6JDH2_WESOR|nr:uncharacterized protein EI97DRAFT_126257 [Westerdykella ornata]KAF2274327.1 hypothetical protein EI97DRAFT_126257 [Westerdykella ornata]
MSFSDTAPLLRSSPPSSRSSSSTTLCSAAFSSSRSSSSTTLSSAADFTKEIDRLRAAARPAIHTRKSSKEHQVALRALTKSWIALPESPHQCQAIMYSSWTRFSCSRVSNLSSDDLKASVLCAPRPTTPDFNPPLFERTYLGADQPDMVGNPEARRILRRPHRRAKSSLNNSWSTVSSSQKDGQSQSTGLRFGKSPIKKPVTISLLTQKMHSPKEEARKPINPIGFFAKAEANEGKPALSASMLPSAFDSDSEDDESEEELRKHIDTPGVLFEANKGKGTLGVSMLPSAFDSDSEDEGSE